MAWLTTRICGCSEGGFATDTISGNTTNYTIPVTGTKPALLDSITTTGNYTLGGPIATVTDQRLIIYVDPASPNPLTLLNEDLSSSATNRITIPTGGDLAVAPGQYVTLVRQGSATDPNVRWTVVDGTAVSLNTTVGTPQSISSTENNLVLTSPAPVIPLQPSANSTITGVVWPDPALPSATFVNDSAYYITIPSQSGSSTVGNQWITPGDITYNIPPGGTWIANNSPGIGITIVGGTSVNAPGDITLPLVAAPPDPPPTGYNTLFREDDATLKQMDSLGNVTDVGGGRTEGTLAALGNNQGNAAPIITDAVLVSDSDGTKGVILPDKVAGIIAVWNGVAATLKVYPPSGQGFIGGTANAAVSQGSGIATVYYRLSSLWWDYIDLVTSGLP